MDESNNLELWRQVEKTDPQYTKRFNRSGGFSGTATNATYLAMRATDLFGPIGIGWGVEPVREEYIEGAPIVDGVREIVHKVLVKVWYVRDGERGEVMQYGQTTFVGKNKYGAFTDEEHAKKSLTDGMSKCLSLLGFAADIHLGRYDDNKYVASVTAEYKQQAEAEKPITQEQAADLVSLLDETRADYEKFLAYFKVADMADLPAYKLVKAKSTAIKQAISACSDIEALNKLYSDSQKYVKPASEPDTWGQLKQEFGKRGAELKKTEAA